MATGNETIVLTRTNDRRRDVRYPVWEIVATATHDADDTGDVTLTQAINGILRQIIFKVPANTNSVTGQLVIKDNDGNTLYDSTEKAAGTTTLAAVIIPIVGTISIVMGVSGVAGTTGIALKCWLTGD